MMSRNVRGFMSLFWSEKPVICKVHGYCVAGGTDMALCSDLLVVEDVAKIGYPPARVWGVPTTALWAHKIGPTRAKRLLLTGDSISGREAVDWGLATDWAPAGGARRGLRVAGRAGRAAADQPAGDAQAARSTRRSPPRACTRPRSLGTFFDGIARHTPEGYDFVAPGGGGRLQGGGARARRAVRRLRPPRPQATDEGPDHQLADAVRARHGPPARRRRPRGLRRRRLRRRRSAATRST